MTGTKDEHKATTDGTGRALPASEMPSAERLRAYGDALFLAMRSPRHAAMTVQTVRTYLEPPLLLGQYRIFRIDEVPRGMFTWGWLDKAAERKLISGAPMTAQDWRSGSHLWVTDILAPYRGMTQGMVRWIMEPGNLTDGAFYFRRVRGQNVTRRIVRVDFRAERLGEVFAEDAFLARDFPE